MHTMLAHMHSTQEVATIKLLLYSNHKFVSVDENTYILPYMDCIGWLVISR